VFRSIYPRDNFHYDATNSMGTAANDQTSVGASTAATGDGGGLAISQAGSTIVSNEGVTQNTTYNVDDPADQGLIALGSAAVQDSAAETSQAMTTAQTALIAAEEESQNDAGNADQLAADETKTPIQQLYVPLAIAAAVIIFIVWGK